MTNGTEWMSSAVEGFKETCLQELGRNASLPASVAAQIIALACPNECNAPNGHCTDGKSVADITSVVSTRVDVIAANEVVCFTSSLIVTNITVGGLIQLQHQALSSV